MNLSQVIKDMESSLYSKDDLSIVEQASNVGGQCCIDMFTTATKGYVLVPIEPSEAMLKAGVEQITAGCGYDGCSADNRMVDTIDCYDAMIKASTEEAL